MSLLRPEEVRPWAKAIKAQTTARRMPPWGADRTIGEFINDPSLTDEEIATLAAWADGGAPLGDVSRLPPPPVFNDGWRMGEPDLVLTMAEEYALVADGPDRFEYFELPTGLAEERWVRAVEIRPGNRKIVHHVMAYVQQNDPGETALGWGDRHGNLMIEYAVGNDGDRFPPGAGRLLRPGSTIVFQIHYHPYGEIARDRTSIGFKFHPSGAGLRRVRARGIASRHLYIPPGAAEVVTETWERFDRPIRVISFQPHMHCRGRAMTLEAILPEGGRRMLCSVPYFDFNWQITYTFREPPLLPAGTTLHVTARHDNSEANPNNPDPTRAVQWGRETTDEMAIGWTDFVFADEDPDAPGLAFGGR